MSFTNVFRSVLVLCAALVIGSLVQLDAQLPEPLFDQLSQPSTLAQPATGVLQPFNIRSRAVALRVPTLQRALASPSANTFTLNLFDDLALPVTFERVEESGRGQQTWVGHITDRPLSTVILTLNGNIVSGRVADGATVFTIEPLSEGIHRIDQLDTTAMPQTRDGVLPVPQSAPLEQAEPSANRTTPAAVAAVDILVFYSTGVRVQSGGEAQVQARVARYFAETNTAFARSGIPGQVRVVAALEVPAPDGVNDAALLELLRTHPTSVGYRELGGVDLVALLVTHFDAHAVPSIIKCGLGYLGPGSEFGFSAVATRSECDANSTFTHEIGHNLGAQHATEDGVLTGPQYPAYARGHKAPDHAFRTVMAYECTTAPRCPVILNFSNPNVFAVGGRPTGSPSQFNALRVFELFGAVANYRSSRVPPAPPHNLQGFASGSTVSLVWLTPAAGGSPTHYLLDVGTAPGLSNLIAGIALGDASLVAPGVPPGVYFVRIRAANAGGVSAPSNEVAIIVR